MARPGGVRFRRADPRAASAGGAAWTAAVTGAPELLARVLHCFPYTTGARAMLTARIPSPVAFAAVAAAVVLAVTCGALAGFAAGCALASAYAFAFRNA